MIVPKECLNQWGGNTWKLFNGDCVPIVAALPESSIDLSVYSPPFANLYIYSDSEADMGNSASDTEFFQHYDYLVREIFRVTVPGRLAVVHCKDLPRYANRDDTAGLKDFPGDIVDVHELHGWSFHSRVTIWKCPVVERERTNNNGLLHKTVLRDRSQLRQGMADYLLVFRKPPEATLMSDHPVVDEKGLAEYLGDPDLDPRTSDYHPSPYSRNNWDRNREHAESIRVWQRYAEPVWWDIDQMDVLNYKRPGSKKLGEKDERHICPLQLGVIKRSIQLWSNPGDTVLSPFAGIGSEGVGAISLGRRFVGAELKPEYCEWAVSEMNRAEKAIASGRQRILLDVIEERELAEVTADEPDCEF